jgi:hypothetical protein
VAGSGVNIRRLVKEIAGREGWANRCRRGKRRFLCHPWRVPRSGLPTAVVAAVLVAGGCSTGRTSSASSATTIPVVSATGIASGASNPANTLVASTTTTAKSESTTAARAQVPVLGRLAGVFWNGAGFGAIEPKELSLGGDPTGMLVKIKWSSWGGTQATGTGTGYYEPAGVAVAGSLPTPATVVGFRLGRCDGVVMYQAVEWYFPTKGEHFDAHAYIDICHGTYVPVR